MASYRVSSREKKKSSWHLPLWNKSPCYPLACQRDLLCSLICRERVRELSGLAERRVKPTPYQLWVGKPSPSPQCCSYAALDLPAGWPWASGKKWSANIGLLLVSTPASPDPDYSRRVPAIPGVPTTMLFLELPDPWKYTWTGALHSLCFWSPHPTKPRQFCPQFQEPPWSAPLMDIGWLIIDMNRPIPALT